MGNISKSVQTKMSRYQKQKSIYVTIRTSIRPRYTRAIARCSRYVKHLPYIPVGGRLRHFQLYNFRDSFLSECSNNRLQNPMDRGHTSTIHTHKGYTKNRSRSNSIIRGQENLLKEATEKVAQVHQASVQCSV